MGLRRDETSTTFDPATTVAPTVALTSVVPTMGAPGSVVTVQGSSCVSDAGNIQVFLAADASPDTRLAQGLTIAANTEPGDWSTDLQIPDDVTPGNDYFVAAQCWGDGTGFGHPGVIVEYFGYLPQPFAVTAPVTSTTFDPSTTVPPTVALTSVSPSVGAPGTVVTVNGTNCISDAGHIEVFLATDEHPDTWLAEGTTGAEPTEPGDWSADLQIPDASTPGEDYVVAAQCWGDGTPFGHGGVQVEYFGYLPQAFTVTAPDDTSTTSTTSTTVPALVQPQTGYWMLGTDGRVYPFGDARRFGNASGASVAIAVRSDGSGYWITDADGDVSAFGAARGHGGRPALRGGERVSTISATATGNGYWLFTNLGRVFAYGDAHAYGDLSAAHLNGPIIASVATPTGHGYYMVGSDGGVFSFGDARFHGSTGNLHLNQPVVGISPSPDNKGYWLVASDGGVFAFGAPFRGSMGSVHLNRPVDGLIAYGNGYLMGAADGGVFDFSNRTFLGSLADDPPSAPIVGIGAFAT